MRHRQLLQRRDVEMVIVIVTNQNAVNRGQIFDTKTGSAVPLRTRKLDRACAPRPNRIGQEIQSLRLQQDRGMIHPGDAQRAAVDLIGRLLAWRGIDPWPPEANLPVPHPLKRFEKAVFLSCRIEKASIAKMFRDGQSVDRFSQRVPGL